MGNPMKIRAASKDGVTEVKVLMNHEMETGFRKDASGDVVPAWFISEVTAKLNGNDRDAGAMGTFGVEEPLSRLQDQGRQGRRQDRRHPGPTARATRAPTKRR